MRRTSSTRASSQACSNLSYEAVLARSLERRGLKVERQKAVAFDFDGMHFDEGLRVDLLVADAVIVELKSVEKRTPGGCPGHS